MFCILKFTKGHNSIKTVDRVMVLALCNLSDYALYLSQFCQSISMGFRNTVLDSRVDAWVVPNVDGQM